MKNSKILLDTNIIIHRETNKILNPEIGKLFNWLDKIQAQKYIHPITIEEINKLKNKNKKETFQVKLDAYNELVTQEKLNPDVEQMSEKTDHSPNDRNDT
ncbi:MAG: hypothetical protein N3A01_03460, partial [Bacteroidales bacterium]|nr:hypothetical protein [Bacteroidales bacterium]